MNLRAVPSFVWVILIVLGVIVFIALINGAFFGFTQIEGLGSILLLLGGWFGIRTLTHRYNAMNKPKRRVDDAQKLANNIAVALGILTFASLGFAFDQPGNALYNLPIQWAFCPAGTQITREADISNPRPGTTVIVQEFACVDEAVEVVQEVPIWGAMLIRFIEYLLLGYLLMWLSGIYTRWRGGEVR
jgi:hypothetical protein